MKDPQPRSWAVSLINPPYPGCPGFSIELPLALTFTKPCDWGFPTNQMKVALSSLTWSKVTAPVINQQRNSLHCFWVRSWSSLKTSLFLRNQRHHNVAQNKIPMLLVAIMKPSFYVIHMESWIGIKTHATLDSIWTRTFPQVVENCLIMMMAANTNCWGTNISRVSNQVCRKQTMQAKLYEELAFFKHIWFP